jgi:hypothetical protein
MCAYVCMYTSLCVCILYAENLQVGVNVCICVYVYLCVCVYCMISRYFCNFPKCIEIYALVAVMCLQVAAGCVCVYLYIYIYI